MFNIAEQLFPNVMTLVVQLCATGVIYFLYRKFLHQPVVSLLDQKAALFEKEYADVQALKDEQLQAREAFEQEKAKQKDMIETLKNQMLQEVEETKQSLFASMNQELASMRRQTELQLMLEKKAMLDEVEKHIVDVATDMVTKVLEGYIFDEKQMVQALQKEMKKSHARS